MMETATCQRDEDGYLDSKDRWNLKCIQIRTSLREKQQPLAANFPFSKRRSDPWNYTDRVAKTMQFSQQLQLQGSQRSHPESKIHRTQRKLLYSQSWALGTTANALKLKYIMGRDNSQGSVGSSGSEKSSFSWQQCGVILPTKDAHRNLGTQLFCRFCHGDLTDSPYSQLQLVTNLPWMLSLYLWSRTPSVNHTVRLAGVAQSPRNASHFYQGSSRTYQGLRDHFSGAEKKHQTYFPVTFLLYYKDTKDLMK